MQLFANLQRVAKAWLDMTSGGGREQCQKAFGQALFHEPLLTASPDGIVLVRDITFACLSQDILLPFHGRCHVAYVPQHGVVLGLSKLARATRCLSGKVQRVEQLAADLMAAIQQEISPKGVFVTVHATLLGYGAEPALKETSAACGCFADKDSGLCEEVRILLKRGGGTLGGLPGSCHHHNAMLGVSPCCAAAAPPGADGEAAESESTPAMVSAVEALLRGVGEDPSKESLKGSAERYVRWLQGATAGYSMDLPRVQSSNGSSHHHHHLLLNDLGPATPDNVSSDTSSEDLSSGPCFVNLREARGLSPSPVCEDEDEESAIAIDGKNNNVIISATRSGLSTSPLALLEESHHQQQTTVMKVLSVRFTSQCEHHLLPFYGTVKVGYTLADGACEAAHATALSRVVEVYSRRLQVQERLTQQIADAAAAVVGPEQDVVVLCESAHMCMVARGVEEHSSATLTTAARGAWAEDTVARTKALRQLLECEMLRS